MSPLGSITLGLEFLWDLKNGKFYPFLFIGGGRSVSNKSGINYVEKYILNPLKKAKNASSAILNLLGKLSISVSVIIIFGNSKQKMPKDYYGWFNCLSFAFKVYCINVAISGAWAKNSKGYIASVGVGISSSLPINFGKSFYIHLNGTSGIIKQLQKYLNSLRGNADAKKNTLKTASKFAL